MVTVNWSSAGTGSQTRTKGGRTELDVNYDGNTYDVGFGIRASWSVSDGDSDLSLSLNNITIDGYNTGDYYVGNDIDTGVIHTVTVSENNPSVSFSGSYSVSEGDAYDIIWDDETNGGTNYLAYSATGSGSLSNEWWYDLHYWDYYGSGSATTSTKVPNAVVDWTNFTADVNLNSQSASATVRTNQGESTTISLAEGTNTYDISSLSPATEIWVESDLSGTANDSPFINSYSASGPQVQNVNVYVNGSWKTVDARWFNGGSWEVKPVKPQ